VAPARKDEMASGGEPRSREELATDGLTEDHGRETYGTSRAEN
jgi:hypothetical protein